MLIYYHNKLILSSSTAQLLFIIVRHLELLVFVNCIIKAFGLIFCLFFFIIVIVIFRTQVHKLFELFLLLLLFFGSDTLLFLGDFGVIKHLEIQCLLSDVTLVINFIT